MPLNANSARRCFVSHPFRKFKELRGNIAAALSKAFQRYLRLRNHMGSIQVGWQGVAGCCHCSRHAMARWHVLLAGRPPLSALDPCQAVKAY